MITKFIFLIVLFLVLPSRAQDYYFSPIMVEAPRIRTTIGEPTRQVRTIERRDIESMAAGSLQEILQHSGVQMQVRGTGGVQADFSLRGSSFEQVVILVDGVRVNNIQTGHHHGNVPVAPADIERIEIVEGHASSLYGADGVGGVIHIMTRQPHAPRTSVELQGGAFGTMHANASQTLRAGNYAGRFSIGRRVSDGYRPVSDYHLTTISHQSRITAERHLLTVAGGFQQKQFGAAGFYADFPSRENIAAWQGRAQASSQLTPNLHLFISASIQQHQDDFTLINTAPAVYQNHHQTRQVLAQSKLDWQLSERGRAVIGLQAGRNQWRATGLRSGQDVPVGDAEQQQAAAFAEIALPLGADWLLNSGLRLDHHSGWGLQVNPMLNVAFQVSDCWRWHAGAGRVFRAPKMTELFYHDPGNIGNADLKPERGWTVESGVEWNSGNVQVELVGFARFESNRIDWMKTAATEPWRAGNLHRVEVYGVSTAAGFYVGERLRFNVNYLLTTHERQRTDAFFKYSWNVPQQHLAVNLTRQLPWNLALAADVQFYEQTRNEFWLANMKFSRHFKWGQIFIKLNNALDAEYRMVPFVPMPGRHLMTGLTWRREK